MSPSTNVRRLTPSADISSVLAWRLGASRTIVDLTGPPLVLWGGACEDVGGALKGALGSDLPLGALSRQDLEFRHGQFTTFKPGQRVLVVTNFTLTTSSVASGLRTLRRM